MKVAILKCDDVLEKFQTQFGNYDEMIKQMLLSVDSSITFETFDCQNNEYPNNINNFDFFITTGSKASVYEDQSWIKKLIQFIQHLNTENKKLIGICFGHQLIAQALGGLTEKSENGWGVGLKNNKIETLVKWMPQPINDFKLLVSHQDQVTQLTDQATVLASNDHCPNFMVQWGDNFLGIQGHPEWQNGYSEVLMHERKTIISEVRIKAGLASLTSKPDNQLVANWIMSFVCSK